MKLFKREKTYCSNLQNISTLKKVFIFKCCLK
jgi:hypothetical protein